MGMPKGAKGKKPAPKKVNKKAGATVTPLQVKALAGRIKLLEGEERKAKAAITMINKLAEDLGDKVAALTKALETTNNEVAFLRGSVSAALKGSVHVEPLVVSVPSPVSVEVGTPAVPVTTTSETPAAESVETVPADPNYGTLGHNRPQS